MSVDLILISKTPLQHKKCMHFAIWISGKLVSDLLFISLSSSSHRKKTCHSNLEEKIINLVHKYMYPDTAVCIIVHYRLRFAKSGWSISILGTLYWKIIYSNFLQSKVLRLGSRSQAEYFFSIFRVRCLQACQPCWVDMLRGGVSRKFEKFNNWAKPSSRLTQE
jgi:hypothetical protein